MTYDPWQDLASRSELTYGVVDLPPGSGDAWWLPNVPGIAMNRGLTRIERRCALAHELVHVDFNDRQCCEDGPGGPRIARRREEAADEIAAMRLIPLAALADALSWALGPEEVAEELDVTPAMVRRRIRALRDDEKEWIEARIARKEESA